MSAECIIVTIGFSVSMPSFTAAEGESRLLTNMEALELDEIPDSIAVINGRVIRVESASLLSRLSDKVAVSELMDHILFMVDPEVFTLTQKRLEKGGVTFCLGAKVGRVENNRVYYERNGAQEQLEVGAAFMAADHTPSTEGLNTQSIGLEFDQNAIRTNLYLRTGVSNIYAIGDANGKAMLARTASHEGMVVVASICGRHGEIHYDRIPSCIYLESEVVCIGLMEPQVRGNYGDNLKVGRLSMMANGKSLVEGDTDGLFKVIMASDTGKVLGIHLCSQHVIDMVGEVSVAMTAEATVEELTGSIHPYPTVNGALGEAFMTAWSGKTANSLQVMKILCMGGSFTFGYGVSAARRWMALYGQMLGMELMNCAVSDSTTSGMLARLEYQTDRVRPGMILLMGGFNDILLSGSDVVAQDNLGTMGHITAGRGATPVFGAPPLPYPPIRVK